MFSDHTRPIESFTMKDLQELKVAYQPPTAVFDEVKETLFRVVAVDDYFAESRPLVVWVQIERAFTPGPRYTIIQKHTIKIWKSGEGVVG